MSPIVTEHQAIYSGDIIINYYLHDPSVLGPSSNSLSALSLCDLNVGRYELLEQFNDSVLPKM